MTSVTEPMPSDRAARQTNVALEIALLALIWGRSFTLIKVAIETVPPLTMVAARVTVAALLLALLAMTDDLFHFVEHLRPLARNIPSEARR